MVAWEIGKYVDVGKVHKLGGELATERAEVERLKSEASRLREELRELKDWRSHKSRANVRGDVHSIHFWHSELSADEIFSTVAREPEVEVLCRPPAQSEIEEIAAPPWSRYAQGHMLRRQQRKRALNASA